MIIAGGGAAVAVAIIAAVLLGGGIGPDLDRIIETNDCDAALALVESDLESATAGQQLSLGALIVSCSFFGTPDDDKKDVES